MRCVSRATCTCGEPVSPSCVLYSLTIRSFTSVANAMTVLDGPPNPQSSLSFYPQATARVNLTDPKNLTRRAFKCPASNKSDKLSFVPSVKSSVASAVKFGFFYRRGHRGFHKGRKEAVPLRICLLPCRTTFAPTGDGQWTRAKKRRKSVRGF